MISVWMRATMRISGREFMLLTKDQRNCLDSKQLSQSEVNHGFATRFGVMPPREEVGTVNGSRMRKVEVLS